MPPTDLTICSTCGITLVVEAHFCHICGTRLGPGTTGAPVTERRIISVLFADLEGFTAFSAERDPEDVREMLTGYFEVCRRSIARHGGVIEKFIGDAVMAVWGTPIAREDDSERAVKAALELVASVSEIETSPGQFLRVRGGVVTGEAAVTLGMEGQGMVAGDIVNTASRLQSCAPAGAVYVDDATHEATDNGIMYVDGGTHELKGKPEPVHVWNAQAVAPRTYGIEAPYLGRDADMRLLTQTVQSVLDRRRRSADQSGARRVSVVGAPGTGKSRLALELERYLAGISDFALLATGHSSEFGQGGSFEALSEIVQTLLKTGATDTADVVFEKIATALRATIDSEQEVEWIRARVMQLIRPDRTVSFEPGELFTSWRSLLQSMAAVAPLVLIFEELQWAEAGLERFLTDLVASSKKAPILVVTLSRSGGHRDAAADGGADGTVLRIDLGPLTTQTIEDLVGALVPGLDPRLRAEIAASAEGVPLYAVETLRMLAHQGILARDETTYRVQRPIEHLEIPQTVQRLAGVRLDALRADERHLIQAAAVLGLRFKASALALVAQLPAAELTSQLGGLTREEILRFEASDSSGEGTYYFMQGLFREGAYARLSKKVRLRLHLAAAHAIEAEGIGESPEVIAFHYLEAHRMDATVVEALEGARKTLQSAAERAASVGAVENAERFYLSAIEVTEDAHVKGNLWYEAGEMAMYDGVWSRARTHYTESRRLAEVSGDTILTANAICQMARVAGNDGDATDALMLMREAHALLPADAPLTIEGLVVRRHADYEFIAGFLDTANALSDRGCEIAAAVGDPQGMAEALHTRGWPLGYLGRVDESTTMFAAAHEFAERSGNLFTRWEAMYRDSCIRSEYGQLEEVQELERRWAALAVRTGERVGEILLTNLTVKSLYFRGQWDAVLTGIAAVQDQIPAGEPSMAPYRYAALVHSHRGERTDTDAHLALIPLSTADHADTDWGLNPLAHAGVALDRGEDSRAFQLALPVLQALNNAGPPRLVEEAFMVAATAARSLGKWSDVQAVIDLAGATRPARRTVPLQGQVARATAHLLIHQGDVAEGRTHLARAVAGFRTSDQPYDLAIVLGELAECARVNGFEAGGALAEATDLLHALGMSATPALTR